MCMRINISNFNTTNFKGYDACPLKNIYMQGITTQEQKNIYGELKRIGKKEGFDVLYYDGISKVSSDNEPEGIKFTSRWAQDDKTFIERNGEKVILSDPEKHKDNRIFCNLINTPINNSIFFMTGGNMFIGKKPNGEKWAIIGLNEEEEAKRDFLELDGFSEAYDIKRENIHFISRPNYHIDMAIRPIGYPYILVNDEKIAKKNAEKFPELKKEVDAYYEKLKREHPFSKFSYADCDKTVEELEKAGFIPIRIGGVYTKQINYMNAFVNQHQDGTMSYITNSAEHSEFSELDKVFEEELKQKIPEIKKTYFISGGKTESSEYPNSIMAHLGELHGGIHCMTLEEPNFERWA